MTIRAFTEQDYDAATALWAESDGVGLSEADSRDAVTAYLARNPGCSFVAYDRDTLVAAALCGHDGRRGYLYHLAVRPAYRRRGIGGAVCRRCVAALRGAGITKCHLFVFAANHTAQAFWRNCRWTKREDLIVYSSVLGDPGTTEN